MTQPSLEWTVHPFRARPRLGVLVVGIILAMCVGAGFWTKSLFWPMFSFLVLFLSLESFFFPTRYSLEEGRLTVIRRFSRSEREWGVFRRCTVDRDGITLSPYSTPSRMDPYRAIRLRFLPGNRDEVVAFVRARLGDDVTWKQDRNWRPGETAA